MTTPRTLPVVPSHGHEEPLPGAERTRKHDALASGALTGARLVAISLAGTTPDRKQSGPDQAQGIQRDFDQEPAGTRLALTPGMPISPSLSIPPTVNMHIVGHCNFRCEYCYARFEQSKTYLPLPAARIILRALREHGARRITFAGGEPMLHRNLEDMLRICAELGLVTSVVTNGSRFDRDACRRLFPWLRWLVLSCDSHVRATNDALGRKAPRDTTGQPARVDEIVGWLREWNAGRSEEEHVRLKVNIVVTALNAHEDPSAWLSRLKPERVKLLQCCIIPGENDDARHLQCDDHAFEQYRARVAVVEAAGVKVVAETSEDLLESYAMVDPRGRFRQAYPERYVESAPIDEIGVAAAWQQVGGCNIERFRARGGEYDAGAPNLGVRHPIVAIEGLDGSGKSTVVRALSARLNAAIVGCPPSRLRTERIAADALAPADRRAWYWKANREAMNDAIDVVFRGQTVVTDRSFASTAAYGAAERGAVASLDDVPRDMPKPDAIFFLSLPEDERQRRLHGRGDARTPEENRLSHDEAFRQRVVEGYRALGTVSVDAQGPVEEIVEQIVREVAGQ